MARRARSHTFDEQVLKLRRLTWAAVLFAGARSFHIVRRLLTPRLMALSGLALFGWAIVLAFRVINMDASHQLQQPAVDFAICGGLGLLGLSISWVHLGENPASSEKTEEESQPRLLRPSSLQRPNFRQFSNPTLLPFRRTRVPRTETAAQQRPRSRG
jgi:hypothetical protein